MTPYAKRLLKYAIANCSLRLVRKGKTEEELEAEKEQWAINFLNGALGLSWPQRKGQPKAVRVIVTTTDEDDE
ncbi:hypothetical protein [Shewanella decolorationis]|uniref:hypothetical protein n=1 Tax=Shewanella decolorationis TaxID=256839 RepID=UPI0010572010|nr:hypothetical protein [Shewanella decolorationis]